VISSEQIDQLLVDSNVSYQLPVLNISNDNEGLDLREEVLGVEDDLWLSNSESTVPNSCPKVTEVNQILQELTGEN
jgi:hypothetical protein